MLYSSIEFIYLFLFSLICYMVSTNYIYRMSILLFASGFFYFYSGFFDSVIFGICLIVMYFGTFCNESRVPQRARSLLFYFTSLLLAANLFYGKYSYWFATEVLNHFDFNPEGIEKKVLPIGISFYTLQGIGYLIDVKNKNAKREPFLISILFISFFGQLIAGPIVRYNELVPQLKTLNVRVNYEHLKK